MHLQIIILSIGWGRQIQTWPKQTKPNPGMVEGRAHCLLEWGFYKYTRGSNCERHYVLMKVHCGTKI